MLLRFFVVHTILWKYVVTAMPPSLQPSKNSSENLVILENIQSNKIVCNLDNEAIAKRFSLHLEPLNWFEALIVCWKEGGQLAVPRSPQEAKALGGLLFKTRTPAGEVLGEALHVGIQDIAKTGHWRTLDGSLLSEVGYDLWMPEGDGECGALMADGCYLQQPCHTRMRFACEKPISAALRQASDYVEVGDAGRFRLYEEPLPWALALRHCEEEGASLAVPASAREAGLLAGVLFTRAASNPGLQRNGFFVGITDVAKEGDWRTLKGEPLSTAGYESWAHSHPTGSRRENCGALQRDGRYANYPCMSPMAYACQENTTPRDSEKEVVVRGRYRLHKKPLPWFEALQACQRENATLVAVSRSEKSNVKELLKGRVRTLSPYYGYPHYENTYEIEEIHVSIYNFNSTWISIYGKQETSQITRRAFESLYENSNNMDEYDENSQTSEDVVVNVRNGEHLMKCAGMTHDGTFYTNPCSEELPYLCKSKQ